MERPRGKFPLLFGEGRVESKRKIFNKKDDYFFWIA
jgi:hypothetical protein